MTHPARGQGEKRSRRDPRIDVLRGFALLTIFIDHIPGNTLGLATLRNFGFADAAELFVLLAGLSSMAAYGRLFEREGIGSGLRRIALRCLRLYVFQALLLAATLVLVKSWSARYGLLLPDLVPFLASGMAGVKHSLTLAALPPDLNILPLYIVLMALFPMIYAAIKWNPPAALTVSGLVWVAANCRPGLNLTNWIDGQGWFFNPFAWQFLFVIGAVGWGILSEHDGALPRRSWLVWLCWGYLAFALISSAPWSAWGIADFRPIALDAPDKTNLAPLRLLDVLALIYLALSSPRFLAVVRGGLLAPVETCGKHSLEVFALATLLSLAGRLWFTAFGAGWQLQVAINGIGFAALIAMAGALEGTKGRGIRPALTMLPRLHRS